MSFYRRLAALLWYSGLLLAPALVAAAIAGLLTAFVALIGLAARLFK